MQVYFVASSRLVAKNVKLYSQIYKTISSDHKMVSDKVLKWIKGGIKDLSKESIETKKENYLHVIKCIKKADIVVMEISGHSVSMGFILSKAMEENKPVIAMYTADMDPVFVKGIVNSKLILAEYKKENLEQVIIDSINKAKCLVDMRFNFFVSPRILNYLDWIAQKRMIPKSVFLRHLIEREMKKDREFKG